MYSILLTILTSLKSGTCLVHVKAVLEHFLLFSLVAPVVRHRSVHPRPSFLCQWEDLQVLHSVSLAVPWLVVVQHLVPEVLLVLRCHVPVSQVVLRLVDVRVQL